MSSEEVLEKEYLPQKIVVPDKIGEVDESICEEILACKKSGRNFKIQKAELAFYKKMGLPIPQYCPDERHYARLKFRNPRKLYLRKCEKCKMDIKTTFAPDRPEKIYCENCYREEVFR